MKRVSKRYKIKKRKRLKLSVLRPRSELWATHPQFLSYTDIELWMVHCMQHGRLHLQFVLHCVLFIRFWCPCNMVFTLNLVKTVPQSGANAKSCLFMVLMLTLITVIMTLSQQANIPTISHRLLTSRLFLMPRIKGQTQTNNLMVRQWTIRMCI